MPCSEAELGVEEGVGEGLGGGGAGRRGAELTGAAGAGHAADAAGALQVELEEQSDSVALKTLLASLNCWQEGFGGRAGPTWEAQMLSTVFTRSELGGSGGGGRAGSWFPLPLGPFWLETEPLPVEPVEELAFCRARAATLDA